MVVVWLFLAVPWVCLRFLIVVFPVHTHLQLFTVYRYGFLLNFTTVGQASDSMTVPWVGLQFVIVVFPDHTYLRFDVKLAFVGWCLMCVLT